jgi:molecular chaperone DnaJ
LSVKIPAGVDEGTRIRVSGEGEAGIRGAANGDLYIFVHMKRHSIYEREGTTLVADCPVSFTAAALGGTISLPGLDGAKVDVKIPAGIQSGEQIRQRGAGMTVLNGRGRGDLVARILVETPTRMSSKQRKLLEEFRETETGDECPSASSFFGRIKEMFG